MAALEDTMNITLCGLFLLLLSQICFDAFSAVTVQYSVIHDRTLNTRTCIDWPRVQLRISPKREYPCLLLSDTLCGVVTFQDSTTESSRNISKRLRQAYISHKMCFPPGRNQIVRQEVVIHDLYPKNPTSVNFIYNCYVDNSSQNILIKL